MRSLEDLAVTATAQGLLVPRHANHLLQLRSWRSSLGADLPNLLRARILDALSYAFDLEMRGGTGVVRAGEVAFWMECLFQLVETAPWAPQPMVLRIENLRTPVNLRVLRHMAPHALVAVHFDGPAVCDELMHTLARLPALVSVTLACPAKRGARLSDAGVSALAGCCSLIDLAVTGSDLSDTGANALRRLTTLVCLNLSGSTKLSNIGLKALTKSSARQILPMAPDAMSRPIASRPICMGLSHLTCMLLLDVEHITTGELATAAAALQPGAEVFWSKRAQSPSDAPACFRARAVVSTSDADVEPCDHAAAHTRLAAATTAARRRAPTIELAARATAGKGLTSLSVSTVENAESSDAATEKPGCSLTLSTQSKTSVARMLRVLCAPVQASSRSNPQLGGSGEMEEADEHEDSTRITVAAAHSLAPRRGKEPTPGAPGVKPARLAPRLTGRFGTLNSFVLSSVPHNKKARTGPGNWSRF